MSKIAKTVRLREEQNTIISAIRRATKASFPGNLTVSEADVLRYLIDAGIEQVINGEGEVDGNSLRSFLETVDRDDLNEDERQAVDDLLEGVNGDA